MREPAHSHSKRRQHFGAQKISGAIQREVHNFARSLRQIILQHEFQSRYEYVCEFFAACWVGVRQIKTRVENGNNGVQNNRP